MSVTIQKWRCQKMTKKFCISTNGLSKDQKHEFATELNEFVQKKKKQFIQQNQEDSIND